MRSPVEPTTPAQVVQQDTQQAATKQGTEVRETLNQTKQDLADLEALKARIDELERLTNLPLLILRSLILVILNTNQMR